MPGWPSSTHAGQLPIGQDYVHEGILGTTWTGHLLRETQVGPLRAVVPRVTGRGWITGTAEFVVADDDPFPERLHGGRYLGTHPGG